MASFLGLASVLSVLISSTVLRKPLWAEQSDRPYRTFAPTFFAAVIQVTNSRSCCLTTGFANQQDVGQLDRHLLGETSTLWVTLTASYVFVNAVYAFHDKLARLEVDAQHLTTDSTVVPDLYFDGIVDSNIHHTTSFARLTIFMKFRSRSSRATAPKIRVPRGLLSASMSTTALLSKRM